MTAPELRAVPAVLVEFMKQAPTFVAIGRLSPEKGFDLLLEAFATANTRNGGLHRLLIVGEGPERPKLERRIEDLGLRQNACLGGFVEGADRFLEHAAGFVMSSYTEGMPLVLLEAMQWESPILATGVGGIPEILHGCSRATLVPPRDMAAYAEAFGELMASRAAGAAIGRSFGPRLIRPVTWLKSTCAPISALFSVPATLCALCVEFTCHFASHRGDSLLWTVIFFPTQAPNTTAAQSHRHSLRQIQVNLPVKLRPLARLDANSS